MSTATLGVTAGVDSALRRAFSEASVRLQPEARLSELITALEALGIAVEITDGVLVLRQGDTMMHTALALRSLVAKPEFKKFFVYSTDDPRSKITSGRTARTRTASYSRSLCSMPASRRWTRTCRNRIT